MKQILVGIILVSFLLAGCQQKTDGYVIQGEVEGLADGNIYLKSFRNKILPK